VNAPLYRHSQDPRARTLNEVGPPLGYLPNGCKTWLVVKPGLEDVAREAFMGTKVQITSEGHRHLGAVIGSHEFMLKYVGAKVDEWVLQIETLTEIARYDPHSAYSAYTHGFRGKWVYMLRTIPRAGLYMRRLEEALQEGLAPVLLRRGHELGQDLGQAVALPSSSGGHGANNRLG